MDKKRLSKPTIKRILTKLGVKFEDKFSKEEMIELLKMKEYELSRSKKTKFENQE
jgi:hypothetical protein